MENLVNVHALRSLRSYFLMHQMKANLSSSSLQVLKQLDFRLTKTNIPLLTMVLAVHIRFLVTK
jgi:hypothetical protein